MPTIRYNGDVRPKHAPLTVAYRPSFSRVEAQEDPDADFSVQIEAGRVLVRVDVREAGPDTASELYVAALQAAQLLADAAGFLSGVPYIVSLDQWEDADGVLHVAALGDQALGDACEAAGLDDLPAVYELALQDIALAQTLSDALKMLHIPDYAPVAAGRVAESLARMIAGKKSSTGWALLHQTLRVDRSYVEPLTAHSKGPRHGERVYVPASIPRALSGRAWTLISRYLVWRLGGPLDARRFPLLAGEIAQV